MSAVDSLKSLTTVELPTTTFHPDPKRQQLSPEDHENHFVSFLASSSSPSTLFQETSVIPTVFSQLPTHEDSHYVVDPGDEKKGLMGEIAPEESRFIYTSSQIHPSSSPEVNTTVSSAEHHNCSFLLNHPPMDSTPASNSDKRENSGSNIISYSDTMGSFLFSPPTSTQRVSTSQLFQALENESKRRQAARLSHEYETLNQCRPRPTMMMASIAKGLTTTTAFSSPTTNHVLSSSSAFVSKPICLVNDPRKGAGKRHRHASLSSSSFPGHRMDSSIVKKGGATASASHPVVEHRGRSYAAVFPPPMFASSVRSIKRDETPSLFHPPTQRQTSSPGTSTFLSSSSSASTLWCPVSSVPEDSKTTSLLQLPPPTTAGPTDERGSAVFTVATQQDPRLREGDAVLEVVETAVHGGVHPTPAVKTRRRGSSYLRNGEAPFALQEFLSDGTSPLVVESSKSERHAPQQSGSPSPSPPASSTGVRSAHGMETSLDAFSETISFPRSESKKMPSQAISTGMTATFPFHPPFSSLPLSLLEDPESPLLAGVPRSSLEELLFDPFFAITSEENSERLLFTEEEYQARREWMSAAWKHVPPRSKEGVEKGTHSSVGKDAPVDPSIGGDETGILTSALCTPLVPSSEEKSMKDGVQYSITPPPASSAPSPPWSSNKVDPFFLNQEALPGEGLTRASQTTMSPATQTFPMIVSPPSPLSSSSHSISSFSFSPSSLASLSIGTESPQVCPPPPLPVQVAQGTGEVRATLAEMAPSTSHAREKTKGKMQEAEPPTPRRYSKERSRLSSSIKGSEEVSQRQRQTRKRTPSTGSSVTVAATREGKEVGGEEVVEKEKGNVRVQRRLRKPSRTEKTKGHSQRVVKEGEKTLKKKKEKDDEEGKQEEKKQTSRAKRVAATAALRVSTSHPKEKEERAFMVGEEGTQGELLRAAGQRNRCLPRSSLASLSRAEGASTEEREAVREVGTTAAVAVVVANQPRPSPHVLPTMTQGRLPSEDSHVTPVTCEEEVMGGVQEAVQTPPAGRPSPRDQESDTYIAPVREAPTSSTKHGVERKKRDEEKGKGKGEEEETRKGSLTRKGKRRSSPCQSPAMGSSASTSAVLPKTRRKTQVALPSSSSATTPPLDTAWPFAVTREAVYNREVAQGLINDLPAAGSGRTNEQDARQEEKMRFSPSSQPPVEKKTRETTEEKETCAREAPSSESRPEKKDLMLQEKKEKIKKKRENDPQECDRQGVALLQEAKKNMEAIAREVKKSRSVGSSTVQIPKDGTPHQQSVADVGDRPMPAIKGTEVSVGEGENRASPCPGDGQPAPVLLGVSSSSSRGRRVESEESTVEKSATKGQEEEPLPEGSSHPASKVEEGTRKGSPPRRSPSPTPLLALNPHLFPSPTSHAFPLFPSAMPLLMVGDRHASQSHRSISTPDTSRSQKPVEETTSQEDLSSLVSAFNAVIHGAPEHGNDIVDYIRFSLPFLPFGTTSGRPRSGQLPRENSVKTEKDDAPPSLQKNTTEKAVGLEKEEVAGHLSSRQVRKKRKEYLQSLRQKTRLIRLFPLSSSSNGAPEEEEGEEELDHEDSVDDLVLGDADYHHQNVQFILDLFGELWITKNDISSLRCAEHLGSVPKLVKKKDVSLPRVDSAGSTTVTTSAKKNTTALKEGNAMAIDSSEFYSMQALGVLFENQIEMED